MINSRYAQAMARYNTWQNANIYGAATELSDLQRREDRGAFFGSIHATLNHILWADQMWMTRLGGTPAPLAKTTAEGLIQFQDWQELNSERQRFDGVIEAWASALRPEEIDGDLTWYSGSLGRECTAPKSIAIMQLFNHQTHHRGQVHALLTSFGIKPGITDLPFGPSL